MSPAPVATTLTRPSPAWPRRSGQLFLLRALGQLAGLTHEVVEVDSAWRARGMAQGCSSMTSLPGLRCARARAPGCAPAHPRGRAGWRGLGGCGPTVQWRARARHGPRRRARRGSSLRWPPRCLVHDEPGGAAEVHGEEPLDDGAPALTGDGGPMEAGIGPEGDGHLALTQREEPCVLERGRVPRGLAGDRVQRGAPALEQRTRGVIPSAGCRRGCVGQALPGGTSAGLVSTGRDSAVTERGTSGPAAEPLLPFEEADEGLTRATGRPGVDDEVAAGSPPATDAGGGGLLVGLLEPALECRRSRCQTPSAPSTPRARG